MSSHPGYQVPQFVVSKGEWVQPSSATVESLFSLLRGAHEHKAVKHSTHVVRIWHITDRKRVFHLSCRRYNQQFSVSGKRIKDSRGLECLFSHRVICTHFPAIMRICKESPYFDFLQCWKQKCLGQHYHRSSYALWLLEGFRERGRSMSGWGQGESRKKGV